MQSFYKPAPPTTALADASLIDILEELNRRGLPFVFASLEHSTADPILVRGSVVEPELAWSMLDEAAECVWETLA